MAGVTFLLATSLRIASISRRYCVDIASFDLYDAICTVLQRNQNGITITLGSWRVAAWFYFFVV